MINERQAFCHLDREEVEALLEFSQSQNEAGFPMDHNEAVRRADASGQMNVSDFLPNRVNNRFRAFQHQVDPSEDLVHSANLAALSDTTLSQGRVVTGPNLHVRPLSTEGTLRTLNGRRVWVELIYDADFQLPDWLKAMVIRTLSN